MENELVERKPAPPMTVTASGNGTSIGVVNGDVHLEVNPDVMALLTKLAGNATAESHATEWALLSTESFQLFVLENEKYNCGTFSISKRLALTKFTLPEYTEHFKPLSPQLINELLNMPCIFAMRNQTHKMAPALYPALVGKLKEIIPQGDCIKFSFVICGKLRQQFINENIQIFNLLSRPLKNQLDEEHWCIRSGNLLEIVDRIGVRIE